ncbi:LysR family transcriptional regulator [Goodfellowiella coeruleoviolacea]|uniref:DNA-binding transcriptional regulator, LysR family n=1 Tax=Goodfellowiella coeruleoviolacea TaxID=334858 RepID=A0AAE3GB77_9PSEU|nr:LysR substrate-binding domain-containing protein [Goodfellowiella coeruleoviolacea]MCP2165101.1 DNA-binding transcriptional regulator, LysR family [Goodfellowiella coeruleoviolacea]
MDVHLRDLRYFLAIAEELNFTKAASRLFISQPALSKQIRQLEDGLRVRLFERDRRTVTLTAAGQALLPVARELLGTWDRGQREISAAVAAENAVLTLGLSTSVGRGLLRGARTRFAEQRPAWHLRMRQVNWDDATAGLAGGEVDVALVWLPIPQQQAFRVRVVATEPRWVALRTDHRLASRAEVAFAELLDEPFLALPPQAGPLRDHWLALDQRGGRPPRIGAVVSNAEETFAAVEEGSGVVLLAEGNAAIYQRPGITALPVTGLPASELAVAWRPDDQRPAVRDLVEALASAAR